MYPHLRNNSAVFSRCRKYRYALARHWDESKPCVLFIGLNPSTADESRDDPTLRKCIDFAQRWGYGGVLVGNLFAFRATDPQVLLAAAQPVGRDNNRWLQILAERAALIVAAWGNHGVFRGRANIIAAKFPELYCLRLNQSGQPAHPLYLKANTIPIPWRRQGEIEQETEG